MNIYELYGRQAEVLADVTQQFRNTLQLIWEIKKGKVLPNQVRLKADGWEFKEDADSANSESGGVREEAGGNPEERGYSEEVESESRQDSERETTEEG